MENGLGTQVETDTNKAVVLFHVGVDGGLDWVTTSGAGEEW